VRRTFAILAAVSLVLMAAILGQWLAGADLESPPDPPMAAMRHILAKEIAEIRFDDVDLWDVLDFIRDIGFERPSRNTGLRPLGAPYEPSDPPVDLDVDRRAIQESSGDLHPTVRLKRGSTLLGSLIAEIVEPHHLQCWADKSLLHIATSGAAVKFDEIERRRFLRASRDLAVSFALDRPMVRQSDDEKIRVSRALFEAGAAADVSIRTDWQALAHAGVSGSFEVAPTVRHASVRTFLAVVLRDAAGPGVLQFQIRNGQVLVSTRQAFDSEQRRYVPWTIATILAATVILIAARLFRRRSRPGRQPWSTRAVAGLVVLLGAIAFLAAAWLPPQAWEFTVGTRGITYSSGAGLLDFWIAPADPMIPYRAAGAAGSPRFSEVSHERWGFAFIGNKWPLDTVFIEAPCAASAGLIGVFPMLWVGATTAAVLRRRRRRRAGRCIVCGYDLRAATHPKCPECGSIAMSPLAEVSASV
jgi:hypothetical protein